MRNTLDVTVLPILPLRMKYAVTENVLETHIRTSSHLQPGHWMAQEQAIAVNAAITQWVATRLPQIWPI